MVFFSKLKRVYQVIHLFDPDKITANFMGMHRMFNSIEITASERPYHFPRGKSISLPENFSFEGKSFPGKEYLENACTCGFMVIQDGKLVYEKYDLGHTKDAQFISWSIAKSVVSALFGIAIEEGYIKSINQTVEEYLPGLKGSGYEGVSIKNVLQMSVGVKFNENYKAFFSDINKWGRRFAWGSSQDKFAKTLSREEEPGTRLHYVSINTHVLGMIITKATGRSLSSYLKEKIWDPLGMEDSAYWLCDDLGMEVALGGLNISLRDYAKLGQLFLDRGLWMGTRILPKEWALASVTPDSDHLLPENNPNFGYGYQWWIPEGSEGEFMAMGVYNQYIYVNPSTNTVIAVNSANHRFNEPDNPYAKPKAILELFREIAHNSNL